MGRLALGLGVVAVCGYLALAWGSDLRRVQGTTAECAPSYLAMDPDSGSLYVFGAVVTPPSGQPWAKEFRYPVGARCAETRTALLELLAQVQLAPGYVVNLGVCH